MDSTKLMYGFSHKSRNQLGNFSHPLGNPSDSRSVVLDGINFCKCGENGVCNNNSFQSFLALDVPNMFSICFLLLCIFAL